jgi:hypothetical protein
MDNIDFKTHMLVSALEYKLKVILATPVSAPSLQLEEDNTMEIGDVFCSEEEKAEAIIKSKKDIINIKFILTVKACLHELRNMDDALMKMLNRHMLDNLELSGVLIENKDFAYTGNVAELLEKYKSSLKTLSENLDDLSTPFN